MATYWYVLFSYSGRIQHTFAVFYVMFIQYVHILHGEQKDKQ